MEQPKEAKEIPTIYNNLRLFVIQRRTELGITQIALGRQVGKSQSAIQRIENGEGTFTDIPLSTLAAALQVKEQTLCYVVAGLPELAALDGKDILPAIKAIGQGASESLTVKGLLALLKIESNLNQQGMSLTRQMIPSLLDQLEQLARKSS